MITIRDDTAVIAQWALMFAARCSISDWKKLKQSSRTKDASRRALELAKKYGKALLDLRRADKAETERLLK